MIVDVSAMAYQSLYVMPSLEHEGAGTGAIFGVLKRVKELMEKTAADTVAWCFDGGCQKRREVDASYKADRHGHRWEQDEGNVEARLEVARQLKRLCIEILPGIGFRNVFRARGYEGDDMVAASCRALPDDWHGIIVGLDADLYQLLSDRVSMWNVTKKRMLTEEWFRGEYGIEPKQWATVKAIAGCAGDGVVGIRGVGEKTAVKFLTEKLKRTSKAFRDIEGSAGMIGHNIKLVELPFVGTPEVTIERDEIVPVRWRAVVRGLGMSSIERW